MLNSRLIFFSVFLFVTSFSAVAQSKKPNIIFILTDSFSAPHGHDNSVEQYYWQDKSADLYKYLNP
jgi:predicted branched-subunit amino acid permease